MLKIVCTEKHTDVVAAGDIATIVADFGESIGSLYMQITTKNPIAAKEFRRAIVYSVANPNSPIWSINAQTLHYTTNRNSQQEFSVDDLSAAIKAGASIEFIKAIFNDKDIDVVLALYAKHQMKNL